MTLAELQAKVALWSACEDKIAKHQSFKLGDKTFYFADLAEVRKTLKDYETRLAKAETLASGRKRSRAMRFVHE